MNFLTDFADQATILPFAAVVALGLLFSGWRRGAAAFGIAVVITLGAMLVLKLSLAGCEDLSFHNPSGHTAAAAVVYGGLAGLFGALPWLAGALAALAIGTTRVLLDMHPPGDAVAGGLVGTLGAVLMASLAGPRPRLRRAWLPALLGLAAIVLFHGFRLPAEDAIQAFALSGHWPIAICRDTASPR
jgi:membrane-associated phospholipid phosphatase